MEAHQTWFPVCVAKSLGLKLLGTGCCRSGLALGLGEVLETAWTHFGMVANRWEALATASHPDLAAQVCSGHPAGLWLVPERVRIRTDQDGDVGATGGRLVD